MKNRLLIYKVVTWRLISIVITLATLYLVTGDIKSSSGITVALHALLTGTHFVFERTWDDIFDYAVVDKHDQ